MFKQDRSEYPEMENGKPVLDLNSGKYVKIWQGPQHPGITGNMSLELIVSGDEVVDCKTHVGYLHRGFEKLMERRTYMQCFPIVCRITVAEPAVNEYLVSAAFEDLADIKIPERAVWLRMLNLELMRLAAMIQAVGGAAGSMGMYTIPQWTYTHRDYILDLFEEMTGGRVYHMYMVPGGVRALLPDGFEKRLENVLQKCEKIMEEIDIVFFNNSVVKARLKNMGIITAEMMDEYGVTGPNRRAGGFSDDVRKDSPYLAYEALNFSVVKSDLSDAYNRAQCRFDEVMLSINLIRQIMKKMPNSGAICHEMPNPLHWKIKKGETYVKAENTRGEQGYYFVSDGGKYPRRIYVRGPSYTHAIALLEKLATNLSLSDVTPLLLSLHTVPPEIER